MLLLNREKRSDQFNTQLDVKENEMKIITAYCEVDVLFTVLLLPRFFEFTYFERFIFTVFRSSHCAYFAAEKHDGRTPKTDFCLSE